MAKHRRFRAATFALWLVFLLALTGCSTAPTSRSASYPTSQNAPARLTLDQANDVTFYAVSLVGTPYRYGGNTPDTGFDCSGLIRYVYKSRADIAAPRTVASLVGWGQSVPANAIKTGDLVVFSQGGAATHAGIYVGEGRFVHAPSSGGMVRLDWLTSNYWSKQQVTFRRP